MGFSVEYLYKVVEVNRHALHVTFKTTSKLIDKYPLGITVLHVRSMDLETYLNHISIPLECECDITVECWDSSKMDRETFELTFNTTEIDSVEGVCL